MYEVNYAKLINLAKGQGLNVSDLAAKAGVSRATIYDLKKTSKDVRSGTVEKLAAAVHVEPNELMLDFDKLPSVPAAPTTKETTIESIREGLAQMQLTLDSLEKSSVSHRGPSPDDAPYHHQLYSFIDALSESEAKRALDILKLTFDVGHGAQDAPESE